MKNCTLLLGIILLFWSCQSEKPSFFNIISSNQSGLNFVNELIENDSVNVLRNYNIYNGTGLGIGDFNRDGLEDIVFGGNRVSAQVYLNKGNLKFEQVDAGIQTNRWISGVSVVDINADGWLDIYFSVGVLCEYGCKNYLFLNRTKEGGDLQFEAVDDLYGLDHNDYTTHTAFFDYDVDGDLDAFMITNKYDAFSKIVPQPKNAPQIKGQTVDLLFENKGKDGAGNPVFEDVSEKAGISYDGWSLGLAINDFNLDGYPDIYVSNDFYSDDLLYINQRDGTFKERGHELLSQTVENGMGVDAADVNNDGFPDIVSLDMLPESNMRQKTMVWPMNTNIYNRKVKLGYLPQFMRNSFQLNNGIQANEELFPFSDIGPLSGMDETDWSWAPLLIDFDMDGYKDLYITNGYLRNGTDLDFINYYQGDEVDDSRKKIPAERLKEVFSHMPGIHVPNYLFRNENGLMFSNKTKDWGLDLPSFSSGCGVADFDQDGDLDLVANNTNEPALLIENRMETGNNYLILDLKGNPENAQGFGAQVSIFYGDTIQTAYCTPYRGYNSTLSAKIHFGLGKSKQIDSLIIRWPTGEKERQINIDANQTLILSIQNAVKLDIDSPQPSYSPLFKEVSADWQGVTAHREDSYEDFNQQPLLLQRHSRLGPAMATGDIDGDGQAEVLLSNGVSYPLYVLNREDTIWRQEFLRIQSGAEVTGMLLFDADLDNDLDLYLASGGSASPLNRKNNYQDRLFLNDGTGKFTHAKNALPEMITSTATVVGHDYDGDGDVDLFVGGLLTPHAYPILPDSYLLENIGGTFSIKQRFESLGMVSSALWTDVDDDDQTDLLVVGEFMPITWLKNENGKLTNQSIEVKGKKGIYGLWTSMTGGDFDQDGDTDYIIGNVGLNNQLQADLEWPLLVYAADLDNNKQIEPLFAQSKMDKNGQRSYYPIHGRDALAQQLVSIKKDFVSYKSYGEATFYEVFPRSSLDQKSSLKANNLESCYLENLGNGQFRLHALPIVAQVSSIKGMLATDVNLDGFLDVIFQGNNYATELVGGIQSASIGGVLLGDGLGGFSALPKPQSGLLLGGDRRGLIQVLVNGNVMLVSGENKGTVSAYQFLNEEVQIVPLDFKTQKIQITFANGKTQKMEVYHGSGYLSQSESVILLPKEGVKEVKVE